MPIDRELLADDEEVLVDTRLHWVPLARPALLLLVALAGAIAIAVAFPGAPAAVAWVLAAMVALPALWLAGRVLRWRGVRLVVTTGRLVYRRGVLGRDVAQLRLQRVAEVHCTQTLRDRLIGCGRLVLDVAGGEAMVIDDIRRPRALQRIIAGQLDPAWYGAYGGGWGGPVEPSRWPAAGAATSGGPSTTTVPLPKGMSDTPPHGTPGRRSTRATALPTAPGRPPPATAGASIADQLIALDQLRRRGILTDDEFHAKKAELLRRL